MDAAHHQLWQRLQAFELDDPSSQLTFTARLARENGWSVGFADRVVQEYKRFIFLAIVADHEVTPSDAVDQAWHLHMVYTRSYWDEMCGRLLGQPFHHGPTKGGRDEGRRFWDQYAETLASYSRWFGERPPSDIWPPAEERFQAAAFFQRVNKADVWLVPKPWARLQRWFRRGSGIALCTAPLVLAITNPLDFDGPQFLKFYFTLVTMALVVALALRYLLREGDDTAPPELTPYQIACLKGDIPGLVRAAIVSLIDRRAIEIGRSRDSGVDSKDYRLKTRRGLAEDADEIERRIVAASGEPGGSHIDHVIEFARPAAEKLRYRLEAWGLLLPSDRTSPCQWAPFLVIVAATAVGAAKVIVGISRDRPVGYLVLMVIATAAIAVLFLKRPLRTRAGSARLRRIRQEHELHTNSTGFQRVHLHGDELVLATALFGPAAVAYGDLVLLPQAWKYRAGPPAAGSSSGCGGGTTGGCGGGGGGGGGGGCGGCGGCGS